MKIERQSPNKRYTNQQNFYKIGKAIIGVFRVAFEQYTCTCRPAHHPFIISFAIVPPVVVYLCIAYAGQFLLSAFIYPQAKIYILSRTRFWKSRVKTDRKSTRLNS